MSISIEEILKIFPETKESDWHRHVNGGGWVQKTAIVDDSAQVSGNVRVSGNAQVSGNSRVFGDAQVSGDAWVSGNVRVSGDARVSGNSRVFGDARVSGDAWVSGDARVSGDAWVSGDARVSGDAWVFGNARVFGNAWVSGNVRVSGDARVSGNAWEVSPIYIQGHRHPLTLSSHGQITIGCCTHSIEQWKENAKKIGDVQGYSPLDIEIYKLHIEHIAKVARLLFAKENV